MTRCDTAIIGGGPAGAIAAIRLARAGRSVTLFEREPAAHHKVCGEFLSWEAVHILASVGIDPLALGAHPIETLRMADGHRTVDVPLGFRALSLSRYRLDEALLQKAGEAGAYVRRGESVRALEPEGSGWYTCVGNDTLLADTVILATGKHEFRGKARQADHANAWIGFKMYFRLAEPARESLAGTVEIVWFEGGYAGLERVESGAANLCFLIHRDLYAACGKNWDALLRCLRQRAPRLDAILHQAEPEWTKPLSVANIPYGYVFDGGAGEPGLYRVGDQLGVIPSFAGDGISIALYSGIAAAEAILAGRPSDEFHRTVRKAVHPPVHRAMLIYAAMRHPLVRRCAFPTLRTIPAVLRVAIASTRIGIAAK